MQLFNLKCNEEIGIIAVHECISADRNLHVRLSYGLVIPLPQWFRYENNCTFTKFSLSPMLEIIKATVLNEPSELSKRSKCSDWDRT